MKAIVVHPELDGNPLVWEEVEEPECGADEVVVDIHATSLNRADLMQRAGKYPPPPGATETLGLDMSGKVARAGSEAAGWKEGNRVCALLPGGGYAERVCVPHRMLVPVPEGWSFEQAAAFPEVFFTAFLNLFMEAGLQRGETVLVHGGASGVGTAAIQMAFQERCRVIVTAGTDEKVAYCRRLGAEAAVNYRDEDFAERIREHTNGDGVDVILDIVGAAYLERNLGLLKQNGRLIFLSLLGGADAAIDLSKILRCRLRLIGSTLRNRSVEEKVTIKERIMERFWDRFNDGSIKPIIDSVYPIEEAEAAHSRMTNNSNTGKIVLKVRD